MSGEHGLLVKVHRESSGRQKQWFVSQELRKSRRLVAEPQRPSTTTASKYHHGISVPPDLAEDLQQQLLGGCVLLQVPRVQVDEGSLEVRRHLVERAQLDQVQEVEVLQAPRALALRLRRLEALPELLDVGTPHGAVPALWGGQMEDI